jgi:hypothetical protein
MLANKIGRPLAHSTVGYVPRSIAVHTARNIQQSVPQFSPSQIASFRKRCFQRPPALKRAEIPDDPTKNPITTHPDYVGSQGSVREYPPNRLALMLVKPIRQFLVWMQWDKHVLFAVRLMQFRGKFGVITLHLGGWRVDRVQYFELLTHDRHSLNR